MYGDKITSEYGRTEGRHRDVIGNVTTAPIGNLILNPGKCLAPEGAPSAGWEPTGHVVLKPSEAMALVSEIIETVFGHENNVALLMKTFASSSDVEQFAVELKELGEALETAQAEQDAAGIEAQG